MKTNNFGVRLLVEDIPALITPLPGKSYVNKLISCITNTHFSIDIIQYQWHFHPQKPELELQKINRAVIVQAQNNIKMRVLLSKEGRGSSLTAINMQAKQFLSEAGVRVKFGYTYPIVHSKLWIFDNETFILGSHNLSSRSITVNWETSIFVKSKAGALEFSRYFDSLWSLC